MNTSDAFNQLRLRLECEDTLPQLPMSAVRLRDLLDSGKATMPEIQKVIASDPALTAGILRAISSPLYRRGQPVSDIRHAVLMLGERGLRSISISIMLQAVVAGCVRNTLLDPDHFARHATFVGVMARYLYERKGAQNLPDAPSPDEVFAMGILHDAAIGLLGFVDKQAFNDLFVYARESHLRLDTAFEHVYGAPASALCFSALRAWRLPESMCVGVFHTASPGNHPSHPFVSAAVRAADDLAEQCSYRMTRDERLVEPDAFSLQLVGLQPEEALPVCQMIGQIADSCFARRAA